MIKQWLSRHLSRARATEAQDRQRFSVCPHNFSAAPEGEFLFISVGEADILRGLDIWRWLLPKVVQVAAVSAFGDVFFISEGGQVWVLDLLDGDVIAVAPDIATFSERLEDVEFRDKFFLTGFVLGAQRRGLRLLPGECYDFQIAPCLGGEMSSETLTKMPFVAKLAVASALHKFAHDGGKEVG